MPGERMYLLRNFVSEDNKIITFKKLTEPKSSYEKLSNGEIYRYIEEDQRYSIQFVKMESCYGLCVDMSYLDKLGEYYELKNSKSGLYKMLEDKYNQIESVNDNNGHVGWIDKKLYYFHRDDKFELKIMKTEFRCSIM